MYVLAVSVVVVLLIAVILVRTLLFKSRQVQVNPVTDITVNKEVTQHLGKAVQFETVSYQDPALFDKKEFLGLHEYLKKTFPRVHSELTREVVSDYSLLYTWKGTNPELKPILLMAHLDVVPVEPGTEKEWVYPPFSGEIVDKFIWGRGSMDIKSSVLGILEAVESLLNEGVTPARTIYLAFGHDEEVGGSNGAFRIAALLKSRNITLEYVLDEGGSITEGVIRGVKPPVALVGVAEKGYISLELIAETEGGHSSMPPRGTGIGIVSAAIRNLERNQMPSRIETVVRHMFECVGPEMAFIRRMAVANLWLFKWLVKRQLAQAPETNSIIRTTTAPTLVEGGAKENVLPRKVTAVVNFRILPGDTIKTVIDHARETINDTRVKVHTLKEGWEPSVVSDIESPSFHALEKTIRQIFPGTVVAPYLVSGATDSRHYGILTRNVFKFVPLITKPEDLKRVHGVNERVSLENYEKGIQFYVQLLRNSAL